jgi:hypothetical protein
MGGKPRTYYPLPKEAEEALPKHWTILRRSRANPDRTVPWVEYAYRHGDWIFIGWSGFLFGSWSLNTPQQVNVRHLKKLAQLEDSQ